MVFDKGSLIRELRSTYPHGHPDFVCLLMQMAELHSDKNQTYVGDGDPAQNFHNVAEASGLTPPHIAWTYALKHIDAISSQLRDPRELPEDTFQERLLDVAVYCLLTILLSSESAQEEPPQKEPVDYPQHTR